MLQVQDRPPGFACLFNPGRPQRFAALVKRVPAEYSPRVRFRCSGDPVLALSNPPGRSRADGRRPDQAAGLAVDL